MHINRSAAGRVRRNLALLAACAFFAGSAAADPVRASDTVTGDRATDMVADLLLVRPLGLVGSVVGLAGFIVSLPFTVPSGSAAEAGHALVVRPFEYTFNRPLGDFDNCGIDRHPCGQ